MAVALISSGVICVCAHKAKRTHTHTHTHRGAYALTQYIRKHCANCPTTHPTVHKAWLYLLRERQLTYTMRRCNHNRTCCTYSGAPHMLLTCCPPTLTPSHTPSHTQCHPMHTECVQLSLSLAGRRASHTLTHTHLSLIHTHSHSPSHTHTHLSHLIVIIFIKQLPHHLHPLRVDTYVDQITATDVIRIGGLDASEHL